MSYPNKSGGGTPGPAGDNGKPIQLQKASGWVQWNYAGDSDWNNLIPLSEISGSDGRPVEMGVSGGYIRWRLEGDPSWNDLIATSELKGDPNRLSIGKVVTLNPGDQATAEITGDAPSQTLSLGLPPGEPGSDGSDGVGVSSSSVTYQASTSGTTTPNGTWTTTIPAVTKGQYLWSKTMITYTDTTTTTVYSVSYSAVDGTNGSNGNGITSSVVTYQVSSSGTITPTGSWLTTVPGVTKGQYLWTRTILTFTNASSSTAYSVSYQGTDATTIKYEQKQGVVVTAGTAVSITFTNTYSAPPMVIPIPNWNADQLITGGAVSVSTTGCTFLAKQSRGTLLLTTGPLENAAIGQVFKIAVIGS